MQKISERFENYYIFKKFTYVFILILKKLVVRKSKLKSRKFFDTCKIMAKSFIYSEPQIYRAVKIDVSEMVLMVKKYQFLLSL